MEILDILTREMEQTQQAFLYEEKGNWYAYENSASLIHKLLKDSVHIKTIINKTYDICLDRAEVDFSNLLDCHILQCSDSELVIDCSEAV